MLFQLSQIGLGAAEEKPRAFCLIQTKTKFGDPLLSKDDGI